MSRFCFLCEQKIFNYQSLLKCSSGFCDKITHLSCIKKLTESGLSDRGITLKTDAESKHGLVFNCSDCTSLEAIHEISMVGSPDLDEPSKCINNKHIFEILTLVKTMYNEIKSLRADNKELRKEMRELKSALPIVASKLLLNPNSGTARDLGKSGTVGVNNTAVGKTNTADRKSNVAEQTITKNNNSNNATVLPSTSAQEPTNGGESSEGFTTVSYRKRKPRPIPPLQGTMKSDALKVVSRKSLKKELFVTRLDPTTTTQDLDNYLLNNLKLGLNSFKCNKLKTKYDTYSSFHLLIDSNDYEKVLHEDVWPEGILIKPFFKKEKISESKND